MLRVTTFWSGLPVVGGGITQLYFNSNDAGQASGAASAVRGLWVALAPIFSGGLTAQVSSEVALMNVDGTINDYAVAGAQAPVVGGSGGDVLPPATQLLLRLQTSAIKNNRRVKGRINLPGQLEVNSSNGAPTASTISTANAALAAYIANVPQPAVWSRPGPGGSGIAPPVTSVSTWTKWAVIRSRRD